jgi:carbon-monoxide dehydrogenase medium subunit
VRGPGGERTIPAADFFRGFLETAVAPDGLLTEIRVPKMPGAGFSYQKLQRRAQDWAIVGALAIRNGDARVALVNMGSTPLRATAVEQRLASGASIADAAQRAAEATDPPSDLNGSSEYREHLARVLVQRALEAVSG